MKALRPFILLATAVMGLLCGLDYVATNNMTSFVIAILCSFSVGASWVLEQFAGPDTSRAGPQRFGQ
jgi:hypothetical protein